MSRPESGDQIDAQTETATSPVADLRDRLMRLEGRDIGYLEMKQIIEIRERFRNRMRLSLKLYRGWRCDYEREDDAVERAYAAYEGIFIRRQVQDSWTLYRAVNRDYHAMRRYYLANLRQYPHYAAA